MSRNLTEEFLEHPKVPKSKRKDFLMKSFVLKFEVDESAKSVRFIFFGHHDEAYRK